MSKVFVSIGLSLDGYMAPEGMTMENFEYMGWGAKWGAMMGWLLGGGRRLFEKLREPAPHFRIDKVLAGPAATHLRYVRA
jgi:hypothetical protein